MLKRCTRACPEARCPKCVLIWCDSGQGWRAPGQVCDPEPDKPDAKKEESPDHGEDRPQ